MEKKKFPFVKLQICGGDLRVGVVEADVGKNRGRHGTAKAEGTLRVGRLRKAKPIGKPPYQN